MRFALLQMAEYINMITVSAMGANLFFGGWHFGDPGRARLAAVVRRQDAGLPLLLHLAARDACPASATTSSCTSAGRCWSRWPRPGSSWPPASCCWRQSDEPRPLRRHPLLCVRRRGRWAPALVVVAQRNPTYSAFALIVTLCSLSAIFGLLGSPFIAVLQIVVYAGAIMVLFLFVLMLLNVRAEVRAAGRGPRLQAGGASPWGRFWSAQVAVRARGRRARPWPAPSTPPRARWPRVLFSPQLPVRVRGHLDPDPGRARGRDRRSPRGTEPVSPTSSSTRCSQPGPLRHRRGRRLPAPQHHHRLHVHRADAQRGQPGLHRLQPRLGQPRRPGAGVLRADGGRGRGGGGPRHHHRASTATRTPWTWTPSTS